ADSTDPDEGSHAGDCLRRNRIDARVQRLPAGRRPLRASGWHVVWLVTDPLLAWPAALQPSRPSATADRTLTGRAGWQGPATGNGAFARAVSVSASWFRFRSVERCGWAQRPFAGAAGSGRNPTRSSALSCIGALALQPKVVPNS